MTIKSKPASKEYQEGYDRIFGKCKGCNGTGFVVIPDHKGLADCPECNGRPQDKDPNHIMNLVESIENGSH